MNRKGQIIFYVWTAMMFVVVVGILWFLWEFNQAHYKKPFAPILGTVVFVGGYTWFVIPTLLFLSPAFKRKR